jgi:hypothetical protein
LARGWLTDLTRRLGARTSGRSLALTSTGDQPRLSLVPLDQALRPALDRVPQLSPSARDTWLVFAPVNSDLNPGLARIVGEIAWRRPDTDVIYGDEIAASPSGPEAVLKPAFNPSLLLACDYIGVPLVIRGSAYHQLGGLEPSAGSAACYDFCLRGQQEGLRFQRATQFLARHPGPRPDLHPDDQRAALERVLARSARSMQVLPGRRPGTLQLRETFRDHPPVTLVVPTRQAAASEGSNGSVPHILAFLRSLKRSTWPMDRIEVLIGDDRESSAIYDGEDWPFRLRRIVTRRDEGVPFNYASKMNLLWRAAETDLIVLMNDDLEIRSPDWLEALITFALEEDVGVVGARLLYPDGSMQHAGMAGGLFGTFAHPWARAPAEAHTYQNWADVHRDWSAVTGAVMATRRTVLERLNGFDERFGLEFNDVDLCLRMKAMGYRVVYTPFAELTHHEMSSRGKRPPPGDEVDLFVKRWVQALDDDPMFHPGLARTDFELGPRADLVASRLPTFSRAA